MLIHRFDERLDNFKINSEKFKQKLIKNNALVICSFPIQILLNEYYNDTNIDIFLEENIDFIEYIESMSLYNDRNEYMISFKLINVIVNIILNSEIINNEVYFDGVNFVYSDDILNKHLTNISEENIAKYIGRGFTIDNIDDNKYQLYYELRSFFKNTEIKITEDDIKIHDLYDKSILILYFSIDIFPDKLNINIGSIEKSKNYSGTKIIQLLEQFILSYYTEFRKYEFFLNDESSISNNGYNISLAYLLIFTKGRSWYNSLGYINDDNNYEEWNEVRHKKYHFNNKISQLWNKRFDLNINNLTLCNIATLIYENSRNENEIIYSMMYYDVMILLENFINYHDELRKIVII